MIRAASPCWKSAGAHEEAVVDAEEDQRGAEAA